MEEIYKYIKENCDLPVALLPYTYKDFEGVIQPFCNVAVSFHDTDEHNIKKMEKVKEKYGEFFMFFNNSEEGEKWWSEQKITITLPDDEDFLAKYLD